ncbi:MAG: heavy metal translocating P-type ATPase [Hyphomicrobiales bacterium]|nr:heavy metal translocating P-type ATPase [Hyphomicrobiales bacterium]MDE2114459.1 heavy metal translocating P-type ATPase [Hyphomicrobiales bacterium]
MISERNLRRSFFMIAALGFVGGLGFWSMGAPVIAGRIWAAGTWPVIAAMVVFIARDILSGRLGVDAVALVSMAGALLVGQNLAGAVVALMYTGGNLLEDFAVSRARRDLRSLVDRAPRIAHRITDGQIADIPVDSAAIGDIILVRAGEIIPVDGLLTSDFALIDEAALTGEPLPVSLKTGAPMRSGALNVGEAFQMRSTSKAGESTYAGIVQMVTAAQTAKAPFTRMADRFALLLLPVTTLLAAAAWYYSGDKVRAIAVFVAATPCPLILAAPVAFIAGVAQAAKRGIVIKGGAQLEAMARTKTVLFDKTGTLTVGGAQLLSIQPVPPFTQDEALRLAASLEQASPNVVARAIVSTAVTRQLPLSMPSEVKEFPGSGIEGKVESRQIGVGSRQILGGALAGDDMPDSFDPVGTLRIYVAIDGQLAATLLFGDEIRVETPDALRMLRSAGVSRIIMLTGDRAAIAEPLGQSLGLDAVFADLAPVGKVERVKEEQSRDPVLMVGDGLNDAPALAMAGVGMAMGAQGASASTEAAGVVILVDNIIRVGEAVVIAQRARGIAMQSIVIGMSLSFAAMIAAALGYLPPVSGALSQEAIDVAVILNALRALLPAATKD